MNDFYRFRCEAGDEPAAAELMIFAPIGDWEEMGDVSARAFAKDLATLPTSVKRLDIHINSPGGSVFEAQAIYSRLADHRSTKHVFVDGLAASAASIIAMVGHRIFIRANATMMVHLPSGLTMGNADDMRHMATALDSITESMINVYEKRTNLDRTEIRNLLAAETWLDPAMAVEKGFADEIRGVVKAAAVVGDHRVVIEGVEHDLSRFRNVPPFTAQQPTEERPMPNKPKKPAAAAAPPTETETETQPPKPPPPPAPEPETVETETETETEIAAPPPPPPPKNDFEKGIAAERKRVTALQKLDKPATHAVIEAAIRDGKQVTDIVDEITVALEKAASTSARRTDASILNHIPGSDAGADENEFGGRLKAAVAARKKSRERGSRVNSRN